MTLNRDLLAKIEVLLNASSTSVPIAQLTCSERFELYIDLLRGHVPFRGGKIRDFPMSRYRFIAGELFEILLKINAKKIIRNGRIALEPNLADYINILYLVERASRGECLDKDLTTASDYYNALVLSVSKMVFLDDKESIRHVTMLLGVSNAEFNKFYDKKNNSHIRSLLKNTEHLLVISNHNFISDDKINEVMDVYGIRKREIDTLISYRIKIVSIKTKKVQQYLDRCKTLFILRGASFWCSQVMSIVRDLVLDIEDDSGILIDSDSIIILFSNYNVNNNLLDKVKVELSGVLGKEKVLNKYPRIEPYIDNFTNDIFPNIGLFEFVDVSLFDFSTDKGIIRNDRVGNEYQIEFSSLKGKNLCSLINDKTCSEQGFVPEWYTQTKPDDSFSFDATLFSLCEISFNQQTLIESKYQLEQDLKSRLNYSQYSSRVTRELNLNKVISYIKFDGDDIGKLFTSKSSIERPVLSFYLESNIKQSLVDALLQLERNTNRKHLVHDLIYAGGDDLFLSVPTDYEDFLVKAINEALRSNLPEISFTCSIIRVPQTHSLKDSAAHSLVSIMSNDLLLYAKSKLKHGVDNTSKQSKLYDKYGSSFKLSHSKGVSINSDDMSDNEIKNLYEFYF